MKLNLADPGQTGARGRPVQGQDISLLRPWVVLAGDRGGGQLDILSALSGLPFSGEESNFGRCPILVRVSPLPTFSWSVNVVLEYNRPHGVASRWVPVRRVVSNVATGKNSDKGAVNAVRMGQLQALRADDWKTGLVDEVVLTEGQFAAEEFALGRHFTPNTVVLHVCGPMLAELSVFVLPSVAVNPLFGTDPDGLARVEDFVLDHLSREGTKALLCLPSYEAIPQSRSLAMFRENNLTGRCRVIVTRGTGPTSFGDVPLRYEHPREDRHSRYRVQAIVQNLTTGCGVERMGTALGFTRYGMAVKQEELGGPDVKREH
ncbi:hypothetical protein GE09DRAFT_631372 [Coniochaeta sp. 2T2.1]|nr:hypothetical protein GE09DRAFT_631372 [Coniochaeta sp. 2T2.1]